MPIEELRLLEPAHTISAILYIHEHDGCMKVEVYRGVSHNATMSKKLDALADAGIIECRSSERATFLHITDKGRRIAELLQEIGAVLCNDADAAPDGGPPGEEAHPPSPSRQAYPEVRPTCDPGAVRLREC